MAIREDWSALHLKLMSLSLYWSMTSAAASDWLLSDNKNQSNFNEPVGHEVMMIPDQWAHELANKKALLMKRPTEIHRVFCFSVMTSWRKKQTAVWLLASMFNNL